MLDRGKLAKLLALSGSGEDAEALLALRKATAMLRDQGLEWDDVLVSSARRGWRRWVDLSALLAREVALRVRAERQARHWHALAQLRAEETSRLRRAASGSASPAAPVERAAQRPRTGHALIDQLLASPELDAQRRARVEAIATWFSRTNEITMAEQADLETYAAQLRVHA